MTELRSPSDEVAERIRTERKQREWSARELAERCAAAGAPELTDNVIENIERRRTTSGRRGRDVTVDQLLVLAYVLEISPIALLLPALNGDYSITSQVKQPVDTVYRWIIGERRPPFAPPEPDEHPDEEGVRSWLVFKEKLPWVEDAAANPQVNNALQQLQEHEARREQDFENLRRSLEAQLEAEREQAQTRQQRLQAWFEAELRPLREAVRRVVHDPEEITFDPEQSADEAGKEDV